MCGGKHVVGAFIQDFYWLDEYSVEDVVMDRWRTMGDPLCDAALEVLFPNPHASVGKDLYAVLSEYVSQRSELSSHDPVQAFWEAIHVAPPEDIAVTDEEVAVAQAFFVDHAIQIMQALLNYSLAAGFAR